MNTKSKKSKEKNTKSKSKALGDVEFKYISDGDVISFAKLLKKIKDDREFVTRLLHHQLVIPKVVFTNFQKISDDELRKLARDFVGQEQYVFKYFEETTDAEFFSNFREVFKKYYQKQYKQLQADFSQLIESRRRVENFIKKNADIIEEAAGSINELSKAFEKVGINSSIEESLRMAIEQSQSTARYWSEVLAPQISFWKQQIEQNWKIFDAHIEFWQKFEEQYKIAEQEAIQILRNYKWCMTPSLPFDFIFEAVKIGRRKGNQRGAMNRLFVDYFSSDNFVNLGDLVDGWETNVIFKPRMKIFRDCVSALRDAKGKSNPSNFVLPTLIAQIDGIQTEFMKQQGLYQDPKSRGGWKDKKGKYIYKKTWFKNQTSNQRLLDLANDLFLNILFQKSVPGKPLGNPFTFNRHKIMHGEYIKYGRIDNTIRAFLILDFLATLK